MGDARARGRVWVCVGALLALLALGGPAAALPLVGDQALGSVVDTVNGTVGALTDTVDGTVDTVEGVVGAVQGTVEETADALAPPAAPAPPAPPAVEPPPPVVESAPAAPSALETPAATESAPVPAPAPATAPVTTPPASAPSTPPPPSTAEGSPDSPGIVGPVADRAGVPLVLLLLVGTFLSVQGWIDRRDPKLALAPREAAPDLVFPAGSARA